jgi:predicted component of type VI protein secretion system
MPDTQPSARQYTYFITTEPGVPENILVFDTQEISIGRSKENDLQARCPEMSRRHATLTRDKNQCSVQNLSTSSGTKVNGTAVQAHNLQNQDVIQLSELTLTFVEGNENPASLGMKIVYASQLKGFGPSGAQDSDAEATILGIPDSSAQSDAIDAAWEVQPPGAFEMDLHGMNEEKAEPKSRDLDIDLELEGFGLDDLELPKTDDLASVSPKPQTGPSPAPRPTPKQQTAAAPKAAPPAQEPAPDAWTLDDEDSNPQLEPKGLGRASLNIEIEGLTPELQAMVQALEGKVISLPALKIRLRGDDLN